MAQYLKLLPKIRTDLIVWAVPLGLTAAWVIFPAIDYDYRIEIGVTPDPEGPSKFVQAGMVARKAAYEQAKALGGKAKASKAEETVEEEDEPEPEVEEVEEEEEEPAPVGDDSEESEEEEPAPVGDDSEESEEEEEEEEEVVVKPLYMPTKGKHLTNEEIWDNFTLKAINYRDEDDGKYALDILLLIDLFLSKEELTMYSLFCEFNR